MATVDISYFGYELTRNVYGVRIEATIGVEFGYVRIAEHRVPVWRKLKPNGSPRPVDQSDNIEQRWRNVYTPMMYKDPGSRFDKYLATERIIRGVKVALPTAILEYSRSFEAHLESTDTKKKTLPI